MFSLPSAPSRVKELIQFLNDIYLSRPSLYETAITAWGRLFLFLITTFIIKDSPVSSQLFVFRSQFSSSCI